MKRALTSIFPVLVVLLVWEVVSRSGLIISTLFPPPTQVIAALWALLGSGVLLSDMVASLWRLLAGLLLGIGTAAGLLTGRNAVANKFLSPLIQLLHPLPPVAIIPLIIVWFGIGDGAKIFSIALAVFFPVWVGAHVGAQRVPTIYLWTVRLLAKSKAHVYRKVIFPASLPFIAASVRTGIAIAYVMVFVSELAGASSGLGYRISITQLAFRVDQMIAALIVLGCLGALTDRLLLALIYKWHPWMRLTSHESAHSS